MSKTDPQKTTDTSSAADGRVSSGTLFGDLATRLREHADRVAGGGPSDANYDPETLEIEHDAADEIERIRADHSQARINGVSEALRSGDINKFNSR